MDITEKIDIAIEEAGTFKHKGEEFDADYTSALKTVGKVKFELFSTMGDIEKTGNKPLMKRIKKMQDEMESISQVIKKFM